MLWATGAFPRYRGESIFTRRRLLTLLASVVQRWLENPARAIRNAARDPSVMTVAEIGANDSKQSTSKRFLPVKDNAIRHMIRSDSWSSCTLRSIVGSAVALVWARSTSKEASKQLTTGDAHAAVRNGERHSCFSPAIPVRALRFTMPRRGVSRDAERLQNLRFVFFEPVGEKYSSASIALVHADARGPLGSIATGVKPQ